MFISCTLKTCKFLVFYFWLPSPFFPSASSISFAGSEQKWRLYLGDICLQSLLSLCKCVNHRNKRPFVSTANEALVGTLVPIGDVNDIFAIVLSPHFTAQPVVQFSVMFAFALSLPCALGAHSLKAISFLVEGRNGHKQEGRYVVPRSMVIHFPFFFIFSKRKAPPSL